MEDFDAESNGHGSISSQGSGHPWGTVLRTASLATGGLGLALVGVAGYAAVRLAKPDRHFGHGETPQGSYEPVHFPSADGLRLSGWFLPAREKSDALVLCHGFHTGRRDLLPVAMALRDRGHNVLIFDFRGHGDSEGRWSSCGLLETRDLEGAVHFVERRPEVDGSRIGVLGFSMGASTAIMAAARVSEIKAVVADSPFATLREVLAAAFRNYYHIPYFPILPMTLWINGRVVGANMARTRPLDVIADLAPRPILLVHGEDDTIIPMSESLLLFEAAAGPKELWTVPGVEHVEARLHDPVGYVDRVDGFFRKWLGGAEVQPQPRRRQGREGEIW